MMPPIGRGSNLLQPDRGLELAGHRVFLGAAEQLTGVAGLEHRLMLGGYFVAACRELLTHAVERQNTG